METMRPTRLNPRKIPRQSRAAATVDAIFEATVQLLVRDGRERFTMTKVAERAGVSVGTAYQYFPHKQALFYAVNERYLEDMATLLAEVCAAQHGATVERMVTALVTAYCDAKFGQPEVTRALYRSVAELDMEALVDAYTRHVEAPAAAMLATSSDACFHDVVAVNATLIATIFGTVRNVFERSAPIIDVAHFRAQLITMCTAYLAAVRKPTWTDSLGASEISS